MELRQVLFWNRAPVVKVHEILSLHSEDGGTSVVHDGLELIEDQTQQRLQLEGRGDRMRDLEQGRQLARTFLYPLLQLLAGALQVRGQLNGVGSQPGLASQFVQQTPIYRSQGFTRRAWGKVQLTHALPLVDQRQDQRLSNALPITRHQR